MSESSHQLAARAPLPPTPSARSQRTFNSTDRDFDSELGLAVPESDVRAGENDRARTAGTGMGEPDEAVHFCLLAEFDIDAGATLADQYPHPTGTDEHRLAELMLPDGAHLRPEDWTVFYLGQTSHSGLSVSTTILEGEQAEASASVRRASIMARADRPPRGVPGGGLLYVLNCVRMKEDKAVRRGAMVKAMAVCSPFPYIGIFKPLLLLALEEYFTSPSDDVLRRLFDTCNAIPTDGMPRLTRHEQILLRSSERKDLLRERYEEELNRRREEEGQDDTISMGRRARSESGSSVIHSVFDSDRKQSEHRDQRTMPKDTHWYETKVEFRNIKVPIRIPMTTFDEDVGEYSIVELVQTFSNAVPFPGPYHPHLHTNGANTHPVMLILNAMLAHKRILFLGYGQPANNVARMVLAACAMASGCGQVLRGMTESAFPYANLASLDILEEFGGYVAGVSNPRFEELQHTWDVLCNLETGRVTVSKELKPGPGPGPGRGGRNSDVSLSNSIVKVDEDSAPNTPAMKASASSRSDCTDNQFIEEVMLAMSQFQGEANIRLRFTEYMKRFCSLASFQEYAHTGRTKIGYPPSPFKQGRLGSGTVFADEAHRQREMRTNGHKIDAWRRTDSYKLCIKDWQREAKTRTTEFDLEHQVMRLRKVAKLYDDELAAIYAALAASVGTYNQVVELLTHLPQYAGGLAPIANGMMHQSPEIRSHVLDILLAINQYPVGHLSISQMNYYHRSLFFREAEKRSASASSNHNSDSPSPPRPTYADTTPQRVRIR